MEKLSAEHQKLIKKVLRKERVVLAYLFGSAAKGDMGSLSDVDIAVLFSKKIKGNDYFNRELRLSAEIGKILKIDRIDIVNLETTENPPLKHNIVFNGKAIVAKDKKLQLEVESRIIKEYEDTKYLRETQNVMMRNRIKEGVFGKPIIPPSSRYLQKYVRQ